MSAGNAYKRKYISLTNTKKYLIHFVNNEMQIKTKTYNFFTYQIGSDKK